MILVSITVQKSYSNIIHHDISQFDNLFLMICPAY
jgi:hypothetical protein